MFNSNLKKISLCFKGNLTKISFFFITLTLFRRVLYHLCMLLVGLLSPSKKNLGGKRYQFYFVKILDGVNECVFLIAPLGNAIQ